LEVLKKEWAVPLFPETKGRFAVSKTYISSLLKSIIQSSYTYEYFATKGEIFDAGSTKVKNYAVH
jgi:hypothetical protein